MDLFCKCGIRYHQLNSMISGMFDTVTPKFVYCPRCISLTRIDRDGEGDQTVTGHQAKHLIKAVDAILNEGFKLIFDHKTAQDTFTLTLVRELLCGDDITPETHPRNQPVRPVPQPLIKPEIYQQRMEEYGWKMTECVQCGYPVKAKCGAQCHACKTLQPCGIGG